MNNLASNSDYADKIAALKVRLGELMQEVDYTGEQSAIGTGYTYVQLTCDNKQKTIQPLFLEEKVDDMLKTTTFILVACLCSCSVVMGATTNCTNGWL